MLTQARLKEVPHYDPDTGVFTHRVTRVGRGTQAGQVAGCVDERGYVKIGLFYKRYWAHRLAWFYMTGAWPQYEIDHINGDKSDMRWCNLRAATLSQNRVNVGRLANNTSGYKGVHWSKAAQKWQARIEWQGVSYYLGIYVKIEDAHMAYALAAERLHKEFARVR